MCVSSSFGGRLQPRSVSFHFIICCSNCRPKQRVIVIPKRSAAVELRLEYPSHCWYCFGLVVVSLYFFVAPFAAPNDRKKSSPRVPPWSRLITNTLPLPQSTFGWLLCLLTKRRPPKTCTPPISQFFDGCHWGAPIRGSRRSEPKPERLAPE